MPPATSSAGFSQLVMGGDFVIGLIVFMILVIVNFIVITKGATRIAEVGARFTLDAIPGKQMSIDADLSAGLIDEKEAQRRRRELEEESSFFGSMDGASKFVRGDAIAGLIITAINIFGGIIIGYFRHDMAIGEAADVFVKLSVGDGLVTADPGADRLAGRRPAGLQGRHARLGRPGGVRPARRLSARALRGGAAAHRARRDAGPAVAALRRARRRHGLRRLHHPAAPRPPRRRSRQGRAGQAGGARTRRRRNSVKSSLKTAEIELLLGKQLSTRLLATHQELAFRVGKMRKKFADAIRLRRSRDHGSPTTSTSRQELSDQHARHGRGRTPGPCRRGSRRCSAAATHADVPGDEVREPAFGMRAYSVPEMFTEDLKREDSAFADNVSVLLTHLSPKSSATTCRSFCPTRT